MKTILIGYDASPQAEKAFAFGLDLASKYGARLLVAAVASPPEPPEMVEIQAALDSAKEYYEARFVALRQAAAKLGVPALRDLPMQGLEAAASRAGLTQKELMRARHVVGEIARTLASRPRFILLDEPFAGIDPIAVTDIQKIIFHLKARGIGVLITDHNVRETLKVCDWAYIMHEGRILECGDPETIACSDLARRTYLGHQFSLS